MSSRRDVLATDARGLLVWVEAFNVLIKTLVKFESPFESKFKTLVLSESPPKNGSEEGGGFVKHVLDMIGYSLTWWWWWCCLKSFFSLYPSSTVESLMIGFINWMCISRRKEDYSSWPWWDWRWSRNVHNARSFQLPGIHASHIFNVLSYQSWCKVNVNVIRDSHCKVESGDLVWKVLHQILGGLDISMSKPEDLELENLLCCFNILCLPGLDEE